MPDEHAPNLEAEELKLGTGKSAIGDTAAVGVNDGSPDNKEAENSKTLIEAGSSSESTGSAPAGVTPGTVIPGVGATSGAGIATTPVERDIKFKASVSHQILTLVGAAFLCFEFIFLYMYFDSFWFRVDLSAYGLITILIAVAIAHVLLMFAESDVFANLMFFLLKGRPAAVYRKWLRLEPEFLVFGVRRVRLDVIDELELSWFGNLIVKSRTICGAGAKQADVLLKLPFAAGSFAAQEELLNRIKSHRPDVVLNKRLLNRNVTWQQGTQITQLLTAGLMTLLLLDVGFSSFYYLELLKHFYLAETSLLLDKKDESDKHWVQAENLRTHPLPISWVSSKFLKSSTVAAGIWEQRARILWLQGKHEEAIENSKKSVDEAPTNLRHRLYQTRLLETENKVGESGKQLEQILKDHKHSLLPRLYLLAIAKSRTPNAVSAKYKEQLDKCYEDTFENEPVWPPGGNCHFVELFYSDDVIFLLDRYLNSKYTPPAYQEPGTVPEKSETESKESEPKASETKAPEIKAPETNESGTSK